MMDKKKILLDFERAIPSHDGSKLLSAGNSDSEFYIYSIDGTTGNGIDFNFGQAENPQVPGTTVTSRRANSRQIDIVMDCSAEHRQYAIDFFNPFSKGKLTVTWQGVQRWIDYEVYPITVVQENAHDDLRLSIRLLCPKPYFNDMDDYGKNIAAIQPLVAFPFVMRSRHGLIAEYRLLDMKVPIFNGGQVPTSCRVLFQAKGSVKNPRLILNDKFYLCAMVEMKRSDIVEFDTDFDAMSATLNGEDILNETDPLSTWFQIPVGENFLSYKADEGQRNLNVTVYFTPKYLGV